MTENARQTSEPKTSVIRFIDELSIMTEYRFMLPDDSSGAWLISIIVDQGVQVRFAVHPADLPDHLSLLDQSEVER